VLPELTSDDLISIGVTSVGHRRKPSSREGPVCDQEELFLE
jgi:hypothetical protein